jgi:hypothetical protein
MSLEKEIQQEKFNNEYEKVAVNNLFSGSWLHNVNASRLKSHGLTRNNIMCCVFCVAVTIGKSNRNEKQKRQESSIWRNH